MRVGVGKVAEEDAAEESFTLDDTEEDSVPSPRVMENSPVEGLGEITRPANDPGPPMAEVPSKWM